MKVVKSSCGGKKRVRTCTFSPQVNIKNKREPIQTQEDVNAAHSEAKIQDLIEDLKNVIWTKVSHVATSDSFGFDENEVNDYFFVDVTPTEIGEDHHEAVRVEVRAEVSYEGLEELMEALNPIIESYDSYAYFEPVEPGIIEAYVSVNQIDMSIYGATAFPDHMFYDYHGKRFSVHDNSSELRDDVIEDVYYLWKASISQQAGAYNDADEDYVYAFIRGRGVVEYYKKGKYVATSNYNLRDEDDFEQAWEYMEIIVQDVCDRLIEYNKDVPDRMVYNSTYVEASDSYNLDDETYEYVTNIDGYWVYRAVIDGKGVWRAMPQGSNESQFEELSFPISYAQARGFEPINEPTAIMKLRKDLGKKLLSKSGRSVEATTEYLDIGGILGEPNVRYSSEDLRSIYEEGKHHDPLTYIYEKGKHHDPLISQYDSYESWFKDIEQYLYEIYSDTDVHAAEDLSMYPESFKHAYTLAKNDFMNDYKNAHVNVQIDPDDPYAKEGEISVYLSGFNPYGKKCARHTYINDSLDSDTIYQALEETAKDVGIRKSHYDIQSSVYSSDTDYRYSRDQFIDLSTLPDSFVRSYTAAVEDFLHAYQYADAQVLLINDPNSDENEVCAKVCGTDARGKQVCGKVYFDRDEEYYEQFYQAFDETAEAIGLLEDNTVYSSVESSDSTDIELIRKAISADPKAIETLENKGYSIRPIVNPLSYNEVGTYKVIDPNGNSYTYDNTLSYYAKSKRSINSTDDKVFVEDMIDELEDNGYDLSRIRSIRQGLLELFGYKGKDADIIIHDLVAGGFIDPNDWVDKDYTPGIYSATNDGEGYWFFTTHGVQPGSVPRDVDILDIIDTPNGSFVKFNRFLSTKELNEYDMKERAPKSVMSAEAEELRAEDNPWIQEIDWAMSQLPSWFKVQGDNLEYNVTFNGHTVYVEFFLFDGAKYTYYIDGDGPYTTNQSERIGDDIEDYINEKFEDIMSATEEEYDEEEYDDVYQDDIQVYSATVVDADKNILEWSKLDYKYIPNYDETHSFTTYTLYSITLEDGSVEYECYSGDPDVNGPWNGQGLEFEAKSEKEAIKKFHALRPGKHWNPDIEGYVICMVPVSGRDKGSAFYYDRKSGNFGTDPIIDSVYDTYEEAFEDIKRLKIRYQKEYDEAPKSAKSKEYLRAKYTVEEISDGLVYDQTKRFHREVIDWNLG